VLRAFAVILCWTFVAVNQVSAQQMPETPLKLQMLWRISFGKDYAMTADPNERDAHAPSGVLFYVPSTNTDVTGEAVPGLTTLYRLFNSTLPDHMDSTTTGEGGYLTEGPLGYVWTNPTAVPGLAPLTRIYDSQPNNTWTGDHALIVAADALHAGESFPYYSVEGPIGYGYARWGNTDRDLHSVSGGGVTFSSNAAAGCAGWEWWWNGVEFVNDYDYGRQLSSALYPYQTDPTLGTALEETGDADSGPDMPAFARHSAPCLSISSSGSTQSTSAIPIEWDPQRWGGDANSLFIYPHATIGKNLTLDWVGPDSIDRQWPVALYETVVTGVTLDRAAVESPTGYLNAQFNMYYVYDPAVKALTPVSNYHGKTDFGPGPLALILASGTGMNATAMGIYKNDPNAGMEIYDNSGPDAGQYGTSFAKWNVRYDSSIQPSWHFRTWIMTDTVQNVINDIQQLYTFGVTSRDHIAPLFTTLYDAAFYLRSNSDIATANGPDGYAGATWHWNVTGLPVEGRRGNAIFDVRYYLAFNGDLAAAFGAHGYQAAADHWVSQGLSEGRRSSLEFDVSYYLSHNPDVAASLGPTNFHDAAIHFLYTGLKEGRGASPDFDVRAYLSRYPDLQAAYGTDYEAVFIQWLQFGKAEGRNGAP
jgi:hypothetical protein